MSHHITMIKINTSNVHCNTITIMLTHQFLNLFLAAAIYIEVVCQQEPTGLRFNLLCLTDEPVQAADTQTSARQFFHFHR